MQNKEKTYILNYWWAANYGANLTAYAIYKILDGSTLLDNSNYLQKCLESKWNFHKNFEKKYFRKIEKLNYAKLLNNKSPMTFLVGSDQVFRPVLNKEIAESFRLDFLDDNSKKISISASFGLDKNQFLKENTEKDIIQLRESLQSFDFISVREKSGVEICKDILNVEAEWIIDPVFMLDKFEYENIIQNSTLNYQNRVVSFIMHPVNREKRLKNTFELYNSNCSVVDWLSAIKTCDYLVTDSYHAVCFAIIFNKPFIAITKQEQGGARFESLFEMLGIENQCINSIYEIYEKNCLFKIDYEKVNQRIETERQKGLEFLQKALNKPCGKKEEKQKVREKYLKEKVIEFEKQVTLKYQIKKSLWNLWLIIWHKYLPLPVKNLINIIRGKKNA